MKRAHNTRMNTNRCTALQFRFLPGEFGTLSLHCGWVASGGRSLLTL
jgi:hypothetical protein